MFPFHISKGFRVAFSTIGLAALLACPRSASPALADEPKGPERWKSAIEKLEQADARQSPPRQGILFVGSSSIRRWNLAQDFAGQPVINHGFGGSQIADSTHYADRIVWPLEPRVVVLYAGDNDLASGKSPTQVLQDYRDFVERVRQKLPKTRILFLAIKPSLKRWNLVDRIREANQLVRAEAERDERQEYVDIFAPMLGEDGKPRPELFVEDGLHLSPQGYQLWVQVLRPRLGLAEDGEGER
jgi:lysophospholipase L1-like esterase